MTHSTHTVLSAPQDAATKQPALQITNVSKQYDNGFQALKGISLTVPKGKFFALLGPNGAGKSTTIGIISTLIKASSGDVNIFGIDLAKNPSAAKKKLGVVPQEFNFNQFEKVFDILVTQAGYFGIPRAEAKQRAEHYLKKLGLWEKREEKSRNLSGGMKRRLMIARAMMHQPELLILDEPSAGVDIEIRRSMWEFLQEINAAGTTIILTTHYLEEAEQLCREIAILDKGNIVEHTSMKNLLTKLNVETFVLDLAADVTTLDTAPHLQSGEVNIIDSHTLEITIDKSTSINHVFAQLSMQNVQVQSMRNKSNRLEELFMGLVEKTETT